MVKEEDHPLVSGLMLTGGLPEDLLLGRIKDFQQQTYPYTELVIINNSPIQYGFDYFQPPAFSSDGGAKNIGLGKTRGQIIATIDPRYYYAPDRIELQLSALAQHQAHLCVLVSCLTASHISGAVRLSTNSSNIILPSLVYIKSPGLDYAYIDKLEDRSLIQNYTQMGAKAISIDKPGLMLEIQGEISDGVIDTDNDWSDVIQLYLASRTKI